MYTKGRETLTDMIETITWKAAQEGAGTEGKLIKGWERLARINKGGVAKETEKNKTKSKRFLFACYKNKHGKFDLDVKWEQAHSALTH